MLQRAAVLQVGGDVGRGRCNSRSPRCSKNYCNTHIDSEALPTRIPLEMEGDMRAGLQIHKMILATLSCGLLAPWSSAPAYAGVILRSLELGQADSAPVEVRVVRASTRADPNCVSFAFVSVPADAALIDGLANPELRVSDQMSTLLSNEFPLNGEKGGTSLTTSPRTWVSASDFTAFGVTCFECRTTDRRPFGTAITTANLTPQRIGGLNNTLS